MLLLEVSWDSYLINSHGVTKWPPLAIVRRQETRRRITYPAIGMYHAFGGCIPQERMNALPIINGTRHRVGNRANCSSELADCCAASRADVYVCLRTRMYSVAASNRRNWIAGPRFTISPSRQARLRSSTTPEVGRGARIKGLNRRPAGAVLIEPFISKIGFDKRERES